MSTMTDQPRKSMTIDEWVDCHLARAPQLSPEEREVELEWLEQILGPRPVERFLAVTEAHLDR